MADREDIIDLAVRYAWALDSKNVDGLRDVFLPDATAMLRGVECNGVDAISKRRMAAMAGDCSEGPEGRVSIRIDREAKTLTISDNGIGMDADEVKRYINQVAFSSAEDFLEKYKKEVAAVTPEDVRAVAAKYLDPKTLTIVACGPIDQDGKPLQKKK